jgi:WD40 repeat protein
VAVVIGDTIELWDVEREQLQMTLRGDGQAPYCLVFSHDGSRLFSGDVGGMVKVWNIETEEQLFSFQAHQVVTDSIETRNVGVLAVAISPDGKTLATAGGDGQVKLWETTRH